MICKIGRKNTGVNIKKDVAEIIHGKMFKKSGVDDYYGIAKIYALTRLISLKKGLKKNFITIN